MSDPTIETITIVGCPRPEAPSLAHVTYEWIRTRIRELIDSEAGDPDSFRDAARALDVLPLAPSSDDRWYGVRPDGDLLSFSLHTPHHEREEEDQFRRAAVLKGASDRHPELGALVPPPPLSCRTCPRCGGGGGIQLRGDAAACICAGLGWLPPVEDRIEERSHERLDRR